MVNENIKPSNDFAVLYYAYAQLGSVLVAANSYVNKTLTFSQGINWKEVVITSEFQQPGAMTNISPVNASRAYVTIVNHTSSAISGWLRVRALSAVNATMTLS